MGYRKILFPIGLALVWLFLMAMAMVDFAGFNAATTRHSTRTIAETRAGVSRLG